MIQDAEENENSDFEPFESESDGEEQSASHTALVEAVTQLDGKQRVRAPIRSEPTLQVSEYHLVGSGSDGKNKIHVSDLAKVLDKTSSHVEIGRKVKFVQKKLKPLAKPLEKIVSEKVRRSVGFENVKEELKKWNSVVHNNRGLDTLSFPLNQFDDRPLSSNAFIAKLKSQKPTELEARIAEILSESPSVQEENQEEEKEYPMTLEEMLEYRKEVAKMRALQSYKAAKDARQKKIKSKKYHRLQRREAVRKQIKNFELLQKTDPEAALKQLEELERARVEERMTLRHRNTGHWARSKVVQAKYDKEARQVLAEQLAISRELTRKVRLEADSGVDSEAEGPETEMPVLETNSNTAENNAEDNPWMVKTSTEINQFVSGYRKFWEEQNKKRKAEREVVGEDDTASQEQNEAIDVVDSSKKMKLIENVVERVELLEPHNPVTISSADTCDDEAELHQNYSDGLADLKTREKNKRVENSSKTLSGEYNNAGKTVKENGSKELGNNNVKEPWQDKCLLDKRKRFKVGGRELSKQPAAATAPLRVISTCNSWVVTVAPQEQCLPEGKRKTKEKTKKSCEASYIHTTQQIKMHADLKIDDLFDEAEEKLKEKIKEKVINLQLQLEENARDEKRNDHVSDQENFMNDPSLEMKKSVTRPVIDEELKEVSQRNDGQEVPGESSLEELALLLQQKRSIAKEQIGTPSAVDITKEQGAAPPASIDPNDFLQAKPKQLMSQIPIVATKGDEAIDDDDEEGEGEEAEDEREKLIAEAFADDDVVAEFRDEKQDLIEKSKPKDIDLVLPGWGDWGGPNIKVSEMKRRRFIIKVPKETPRRDDNKGNIIINEEKDTKIKQHQVSELPFPFVRVQDFEASIRAPVGRNWVPEMAHRRMIAPAVRTKLGTVIEPMDEDVLFNKKKKRGKKNFYPI